MRPFDRGILFIYTITLTLLFMALFAFVAGWQRPILGLWQDISIPAHEEIIWSLLIIYVVMGFRLLWLGVRGKRKKQAIVHEGNLGQVSVSLSAIELLAEKVVLSIHGIKEVKANVVTVPQGIALNLKVITMPDINIPVVSEDMQQQVIESIYKVVGITVHEVRVAVESFFAAKPRVE